MKTLSLAWRNLLRNRRRSLTTLLAMSVGLVAVLLFGGYRSNIIYGTQTGFVEQRPPADPAGRLLPRRQRQPHRLRHRRLPAHHRGGEHDAVLAPMLTVVTPTLQLGALPAISRRASRVR